MVERRVLVTGAAGFIGARAVSALRRTGFFVVPMSRTAAGGAVAYPADGRFDAAMLKDIDVICHAAAAKDVSAPLDCYRINAVHTAALVEAAAAAGVRRFVYLSAGNAYAAADTARSEADALYPDGRATAYLMSKVAGEVHVSAAARAGAIAATILRPSAVYGPGMGGGSMLSIFLDRARRGENVEVQGGGTYSADLVHVDDVVAAIERSIAGDHDGVFNVGCGKRYSSAEAARTALRVTGRSEDSLRVVGEPPAGPAGFPPLDITRMRTLLQIEPLMLEEGLRRWIAEEQR